jgi:trehalose/maltose hydrolase-like predicted phosphorylase
MRNDSPTHLDDPSWTIAFDGYTLSEEGPRETILALGNGMFVTRAALPGVTQANGHYPGTYRAGCYNRVPNLIAGACDHTESLVNLPNWLPVLFRFDGGPWLHFDELKVSEYRHWLDLRKGTMHRSCLLEDAHGRLLRFNELRLVSMASPHLAALRIELTLLNSDAELELSSALDGNVDNTNVRRFLDYERQHLEAPHCETFAQGASLLSMRTTHTRSALTFAMRTSVDGSQAGIKVLQRNERCIEHIVRRQLEAGKTITIEKVVALYTSLDARANDTQRRAAAAVNACRGIDHMRREHEAAWERLWSCVAIEVEDRRLAGAIRLHAFHILQTVSPNSVESDIGIPARGWHGEGYHGHIFWDELFVIPFLVMRFPELARIPLLYRYRRLQAARAAARDSGFHGAMYPWRSAIDGREVTPLHQKNLLNGEWMRDHTRLQRHIGCAIVFNVWQYVSATGDIAFLADYGAEMVLEIARFWASLAQFNPQTGRYEIKEVIGPDEYHNAYPHASSPGMDNNAYTNIMAVWTLCRALDVLAYLPEDRRQGLRADLCLTDEETTQWADITCKMYMPFHGENILSQFDGFNDLPEFDLAMLPPALAHKRIDWALGAIGQRSDDYQITKQADALTVFYLLPEQEVCKLLARLGYHFGYADLRRTARYYLSRSAHRSSLSRIVYAGALAKTDPEHSWRLYEEALTTDLSPMQGESLAEGVHLGAMGGTLDILQRRYLGISPDIDGLRIDPALPVAIGKVALALCYRGCQLEFATEGSSVRVRSKPENQSKINLLLHGKGHQLCPGEEIVVPSSFAVATNVSAPADNGS